MTASPLDRPPRVLVLDPVADTALRALREGFDVVVRLRPDPDALLALARDADVIVLRSGVRLPAAVFESAPGLRLVVRAGVGLDNIDVDAAAAAGVRVVNIPAESATAVAELAFGLMLALLRNVALADRQVRDGRWRKHELVGGELEGRVLGVVGLGAIGSRVARIGRGFGMRCLGSVARPGPERAAELAADGVRLTDLPRLLADSDVVCLAVPLDHRTRHLIAMPQLTAMRRTAVLVNVSRGDVVAEGDLHAALRAGVIAGAATDVHEVEGETKLAEFDNVVLTPHIGAMTAETQERIGQRVVALVHEEFARPRDAHADESRPDPTPVGA